MKASFYLAVKYLLFFRIRTLVLVVSIGIIIFLPNGLRKLIDESERQMLARANSTPLIIGARGSSTDLVINSLYFQAEKIENVTMEMVETLRQTDFGMAVPILTGYKARGFPIVGTTLEYFEQRNLPLSAGRQITFMGECVIGNTVGEQLNLTVGDSIISSPENFFDLAGVYPLKMTITGILKPTNTPDDGAIFTDLKTTWIIMGLGHGHQDLAEIRDPTLILERNDSAVSASAKLFMYNEITPSNRESFHFHGSQSSFPIRSVLFFPKDEKSETILRGRFESNQLPHQAVVPTQVVENLLLSIFKIKELFNTAFVLVAVATLLILGLIMTLSLRLRQQEIYTMFTLGSSRSKVIQILGFELLTILSMSVVAGLVLYSITGFFVEEFIRYFIL